MVYDWQKRLKHERDKRDAYVLCGNPKPTKPDPSGGVIEVPMRIFVGKIFFGHLEQTGHNNVGFEGCKCSQ